MGIGCPQGQVWGAQRCKQTGFCLLAGHHSTEGARLFPASTLGDIGRISVQLVNTAGKISPLPTLGGEDTSPSSRGLREHPSSAPRMHGQAGASQLSDEAAQGFLLLGDAPQNLLPLFFFPVCNPSALEMIKFHPFPPPKKSEAGCLLSDTPA